MYKRVFVCFSIPLLMIGCGSSPIVSSGNSSVRDADSLRKPALQNALLALPGGSLDPKLYNASPAERDDFRQRVNKSKIIYEESGGEDVAGSLYGAASEKLEEAHDASPIRLVNMEELAAMVDYSNQRYLMVNNGLRGDSEKLKKSEIWIRMMISGMNKLPNYQGVVYRGLGWGKEQDKAAMRKYADLFESTKVNSDFSDPAFLSSTSDPKVHFVECTPLVYEIISREGKKFSDFSTQPEEHEVLFRPSTQFRILDKEVRPFAPSQCLKTRTHRHQYVIKMQEL